MNVNVRVPLKLLRAGVKLAALVPQVAQDEIDKTLKEKGIKFSVSDFKPEQLDELVEALTEMTVDVDAPEAKVRIFCE